MAALIVTVVIVILRVPQVCRVWKGEKGRARMPDGPLTLKWSQFLCPVTLREALSRWQVSLNVCSSHPLLENQPEYQFSSGTKIKGIIPEPREERKQVRTQEGTSVVGGLERSPRSSLLHTRQRKSTPVFCSWCKE